MDERGGGGNPGGLPGGGTLILRLGRGAVGLTPDWSPPPYVIRGLWFDLSGYSIIGYSSNLFSSFLKFLAVVATILPVHVCAFSKCPIAVF